MDSTEEGETLEEDVMGIIAGAFTDGSISLFAVPHPRSVGKGKGKKAAKLHSPSFPCSPRGYAYILQSRSEADSTTQDCGQSMPLLRLGISRDDCWWIYQRECRDLVGRRCVAIGRSLFPPSFVSRTRPFSSADRSFYISPSHSVLCGTQRLYSIDLFHSSSSALRRAKRLSRSRRRADNAPHRWIRWSSFRRRFERPSSYCANLQRTMFVVLPHVGDFPDDSDLTQLLKWRLPSTTGVEQRCWMTPTIDFEHCTSRPMISDQQRSSRFIADRSGACPSLPFIRSSLRLRRTVPFKSSTPFEELVESSPPCVFRANSKAMTDSLRGS